ncbi:MAG: NAD(P)/FAD-dependent oxidoreductase [Candidatus Firestonebacteria bacterium]|nr:NAD(P)/FAD-dependent oxidoreductase [Candidatus Firestonebacteria bacterium]
MAEQPGLVVVGHGPAGAAAAQAFRELDGTTPVTIIGGESLSCYARPRLPEVVAGQIEPGAIRLHPDDWYAARNLNLRLCLDAVSLDAGRHCLLLSNGEELPYRKLILAMGGAPVQPPIAGLPLENVFVLRTAEDALNLRRYSQGKQTAALIGGGLLGLEAGAALTRLGLRVVVIEVAPWLLPRQVDQEGSALLQEKLIPAGFEFFLGAGVSALEQREGQVVIRLNQGLEIKADLALLSAGIRSRTELVQGSEIKTNRGILVDDRMQTTLPDIFAAGDVAEWRGTVAGLWAASQAMGRVAGTNAAGGDTHYPGLVPSTTLKVAGVELCSQGDIHAPLAQTLVRRTPENWVKVFLRDGRVIGSIQIGRTAGALQFKRLMDLGLSVIGFEAALLETGFDFNRIPGFHS